MTALNDVTSVGSGAIITSDERTKLSNIEASADVTDATNVAAAGAVMNTGDETIEGVKTFSSTITGDISGNAGTVTNGVYTSSSVTALNDVTSVGSGAIITSDERTKLSNIDESANNYSLPVSASGTRGGVQIGYTENGKNYPIELDSEKMFVNVPWTDTTYTVGDGGLTQKNFTTTLKSKLAVSYTHLTLPTKA